MSQVSTHLSLPYIQGGQAQKHVTHNDALRALDRVVQLSVLAEQSDPAPVNSEGDRYLVGTGGTGEFAGQDGRIAHYEAGAWVFTAAQTGWIAYDQSTGGLVAFDGLGWVAVTAGGVTNTSELGINTSADSVNRLAVASQAALFTHDGAGHQIKVNKSASADTASLLFQTNWSGRAEMGTTGSDDFEIKVSPDGAAFFTALKVEGATGAVSLPNSDRGSLIPNGNGAHRSGYNFPSVFTFDAGQSPALPGAFAFAGHYTQIEEASEFLHIDPNRVYRLGMYLRQESVSGDWSGFAQGERHQHCAGFRCYDADGLPIEARHHARYRHNGTDSRTTLAQPLSPGDLTFHLTDASGWNESSDIAADKGIVIFGYQSGAGQTFEHYSRLVQDDLFALAGVDKVGNTVTLSAGFPASLGNPGDPGGVWPAGTPIANATGGWDYKFGWCDIFVPAATDIWYRIDHAIGGEDRSGRNIATNFPPGTAKVRPVFAMNYSNRAGGFDGFPDTGTLQRVWITGLTATLDMAAEVTRDADGGCSISVITGDPVTGVVTMAAAAQSVFEV